MAKEYSSYPESIFRVLSKSGGGDLEVDASSDLYAENLDPPETPSELVDNFGFDYIAGVGYTGSEWDEPYDDDGGADGGPNTGKFPTREEAIVGGDVDDATISREHLHKIHSSIRRTQYEMLRLAKWADLRNGVGGDIISYGDTIYNRKGVPSSGVATQVYSWDKTINVCLAINTRDSGNGATTEILQYVTNAIGRTIMPVDHEYPNWNYVMDNGLQPIYYRTDTTQNNQPWFVDTSGTTSKWDAFGWPAPLMHSLASAPESHLSNTISGMHPKARYNGYGVAVGQPMARGMHVCGAGVLVNMSGLPMQLRYARQHGLLTMNAIHFESGSHTSGSHYYDGVAYEANGTPIGVTESKTQYGYSLDFIPNLYSYGFYTAIGHIPAVKDSTMFIGHSFPTHAAMLEPVIPINIEWPTEMSYEDSTEWITGLVVDISAYMMLFESPLDDNIQETVNVRSYMDITDNRISSLGYYGDTDNPDDMQKRTVYKHDKVIFIGTGNSPTIWCTAPDFAYGYLYPQMARNPAQLNEHYRSHTSPITMGLTAYALTHSMRNGNGWEGHLDTPNENYLWNLYDYQCRLYHRQFTRVSLYFDMEDLATIMSGISCDTRSRHFHTTVYLKFKGLYNYSCHAQIIVPSATARFVGPGFTNSAFGSETHGTF